MLKFAIDFEGGKGLISIVEIIEGKFEDLKNLRNEKIEKVKLLLKKKQIISAFPEVIVSDTFDNGLSAFMQTHSIGPLKPNIIMMGCPKLEERRPAFVEHLRMIRNLGKSFIIFKSNDKTLNPECPEGNYIDIWWRGMQNGSLMFILAYLLQNNPLWKDTTIRLIRTIKEETEKVNAAKELKQLIMASRIQAEYKVIKSTNYKDSILKYSAGSAAMFLGAAIPNQKTADNFFNNINILTENMPPAFFVYSSGDADLLA